MFYAVKNGKVPGIYNTWNECKEQVNGFSKAVFHKFENYEDACKYMEDDNSNNSVLTILNSNSNNNFKNEDIKYPCAFVDGSYNQKTKQCGFGTLLIINNNDENIQKLNDLPLIDILNNDIDYLNKKINNNYNNNFDNDYNIIMKIGVNNNEELNSMRNIVGELMGCIAAVNNAIKYNLPEINIYYDYIGTEAWANGSWGSKNKYVLDYIKFINESRNKITINFYKVSAHTNVKFNDIADYLAKKSIGAY